MKSINKFKRNIRYFFGLQRRSAHIGLLNTLREWFAYYKKYSKLPRQFNLTSSARYRFFVWHNYLRINFYYPSLESHKLLGIVPKYFAKNILSQITNPSEFKQILVDKIKFYNILANNDIPYPQTYLYSRNQRYYSLDGKIVNDLKQYAGIRMFKKSLGGSSGAGAEIITFNPQSTIAENMIFQEVVMPHCNGSTENGQTGD